MIHEQAQRASSMENPGVAPGTFASVVLFDFSEAALTG